MTKHRRTRRKSQRGGDWYNPISWFEPQYDSVVEEPGMVSKISDTLSGAVSSTEGYLEGAKDKSKSLLAGISNPFSSSSAYSPPAEPTMEYNQEQTQEYNAEQPAMGGKRRRKSRKMRGGKGGLGLTYYATNVSNDGLKVVEPTYWIKGGSKRRKTRRHKKR